MKLIQFAFFYYLIKIIYYKYQALKPYEMRGEKDLLANLVNFSVMGYFPHCYNCKCFIKFSFKDSSKRSKTRQPNRLGIRKLSYMLVMGGGSAHISVGSQNCCHICHHSWNTGRRLWHFLDLKNQQLIRISDSFIRFKAALLSSKI